jgi:hypothetical protein
MSYLNTVALIGNLGKNPEVLKKMDKGELCNNCVLSSIVTRGLIKSKIASLITYNFINHQHNTLITAPTECGKS